MQTNDLDVVYIVRQGEQNEELRYSLRSVAKNMPHAKVWIVGYKPHWVVGVGHVEVRQNLQSKHHNSMNNWARACQHKQITERFVFMNDDMFIMKPLEQLLSFYNGTFADFKERYVTDHPASSYTDIIRRTSDVLAELQVKKPLNYELHVPMIMSKNNYNNIMRLQAVFNPDWQPVFPRSLVANFFRHGGKEIEDVKVYELEQRPTGKELFLSTTDKIFKHGRVGTFIRNTFMERCKYER